jgi:hypothetical protein
MFIFPSPSLPLTLTLHFHFHFHFHYHFLPQAACMTMPRCAPPAYATGSFACKGRAQLNFGSMFSRRVKDAWKFSMV